MNDQMRYDKALAYLEFSTKKKKKKKCIEFSLIFFKIGLFNKNKRYN